MTILPDSSRRLRGQRAICAAAAVVGVNPKDLPGNSHEYQIVFARQLAMWLLHKTGWSYSQIGRILNRHHTTVIHALPALEAKIARQPELEEVRTKLQEMIETEQRKPIPAGTDLKSRLEDARKAIATAAERLDELEMQIHVR